MVTETQKLPDGWQWIKLTEIAERGNKYAIVDGPFGASIKQSDYLDCGVPLIRIQNISKDGTFINKGFLYISEEKYREQIRSAVKKDDILVSRVGTIGNVCIYPGIFEKALLSTTGVCKISINKRIADINFVYFFMLSEDYKNQLISNASESVQKYITLDTLKDSELPFPPLAEQKRIAAIAQKADRLRRTRRYALQLSDTYLQSVFLEMFGDARTNPNNFPTEPLGDSLEKFESGVNFNPVSEREPASQWRVLKVSAVTSGVFEPYESKPIKPDVTFNDTLVVKKGDLLMSRANTRELVGAVCMVREQPPKVLLPDKLWRVKFSKHSKLEPNYVLYALRQPKLRKIIADMASGTSGSMKNISKEQAATLPILIPPFALQQKFSEIVQKFERFRTQQQEAERQAEHLFQTLLHRAFRGELSPQDSNDEPASVLLEQIGAEQAKAEAEAKAATQAMGEAAEYLGTRAKQQDTELIQLKLPGME